MMSRLFGGNGGGCWLLFGPSEFRLDEMSSTPPAWPSRSPPGESKLCEPTMSPRKRCWCAGFLRGGGRGGAAGAGIGEEEWDEGGEVAMGGTAAPVRSLESEMAESWEGKGRQCFN